MEEFIQESLKRCKKILLSNLTCFMTNLLGMLATLIAGVYQIMNSGYLLATILVILCSFNYYFVMYYADKIWLDIQDIKNLKKIKERFFGR